MASQPIDPSIDTTAPASPTIASFSPDSNIVGDGITDANLLTLTGTAEANSTVNVYDGVTLLGSVTANGSGTWNFATGQLADGTHNFTATDTDASNNTSAASSVLNVTVDTHAPTAPTFASFSPDSGVVGDHITNINMLTLAGTAEANSTVTVYDGTTLLGIAVTNSSGAWSFATAPLADGSHAFTATDMDAAGNISAVSSALNVTVDTHVPVAPTVASFSPDTGTVGDGITSANALTLTGTAEANSTVNVYDGTTDLGTATANSSGAWNFATAQLANGIHNFTATDTDAAGTTSAASSALNVTIETSNATTAAPSIALAVPASNTVNIGSGNYTITGNPLSDTFVFGTTIGQDAITNFKSTSWWTNDVLQFSSNTFSDFATVLNHAAQVGSDVVISVDPTDSVTLKNFQLANLHQNNIHIV